MKEAILNGSLNSELLDEKKQVKKRFEGTLKALRNDVLLGKFGYQVESFACIESIHARPADKPPASLDQSARN